MESKEEAILKAEKATTGEKKQQDGEILNHLQIGTINEDRPLSASQQGVAVEKGDKVIPPTNQLNETEREDKAINEGPAQNSNEEGGLHETVNELQGQWKEVVYKKKKRQLDRDHLKSNPTQRSHKWSRGNNTNSLTKGFATQQNQKAYMRAFRERRCFKCLAKDHQKYQCREPFRCFQCGGYGHKAGSCRTITKEKPSIKPNTNPARKRTPDISYSAILKHNKNQTDLHKTNNETMEPFWEERPEEMEVYCATRDYLRPQNEFLESTGMIVMMRGAQIPDMEREIARYFARTFGWLWQDYEVSSAAEAHFMVICPGENIRNALVRANPHTLRPGVQFTVHEWTLDWNMVIDPPLCEAWVRLIGLPVQAWNIIELKKFTTKMGKITAVLPFGREAGHFRHITLKIACEDPRRISRFAKYREGNRATRVRIRLLDWRVRQPGPFPLHPDHWGHGPLGDNRRPRRRHYQPPPPPPPPTAATKQPIRNYH